MRAELITCRGGDLKVYEAGAGELPAVLFVNSIGPAGDVLDGAATAFRAAGLNLVTWDLRGYPGPGDARTVRLADHVADGRDILRSLHIDEVHIAGWCTGASVALFLARELGASARSFTSIDGAFLFDGVPGVPVGNSIFAMCAEIVRDENQASHFYDTMRLRGSEQAILGRPDLDAALMRPYRHGVDGLISYAHAIRAACAYDPVVACAGLSIPAMFVARRDDRMVGYRNSIRAASLVLGAELGVEDEGGHYAILTNDGVARRLAEFMLAAQSGATTGRTRL